jgi:hypothetical protein
MMVFTTASAPDFYIFVASKTDSRHFRSVRKDSSSDFARVCGKTTRNVVPDHSGIFKEHSDATDGGAVDNGFIRFDVVRSFLSDLAV